MQCENLDLILSTQGILAHPSRFSNLSPTLHIFALLSIRNDSLPHLGLDITWLDARILHVGADTYDPKQRRP